MIVLYAGL